MATYDLSTSFVPFMTRFGQLCSDSEHLSDKLLQFIYDSYIVSLMMYTDHAMQEVDGHFSRDAVEFMEQVVILGEAADLKEAVLKASTRLSTWFEVGKIPQRHPHSRFVCDIDIDREAARAYRRKTCNILAAKGRDLENSCLICLETLDVDEINEHKVRILPVCYHMFHDECILKFSENKVSGSMTCGLIEITCAICKEVPT
jgi:hypothetical protein